MGFKYSVQDAGSIHFITSTIVLWIDLFTKPPYAEIMIDSLKHCIHAKGLKVYGWCIMPSHIHILASATNPTISLSDIMRDCKKFTSKRFVEAIQSSNESRKEWLLDKFAFVGRYNPKIKEYKVWQDGFHPEVCYSEDFFLQKLNYIHNNPVVTGFVKEPPHYVLSSAVDYWENKQGLLPITRIEGF